MSALLWFVAGVVATAACLLFSRTRLFGELLLVGWAILDSMGPRK